MKELKNSIEVLEEVLNLSKEGKEIGVVYSEDVCVGDICCFTEKDIWVEDIEDFEENVILDEGFFLKDDLIHAKKDVLFAFKNISDDFGGVLGTVKIGTYGNKKYPLYVQSPVFENQEEGVIGKKLYVL